MRTFKNQSELFAHIWKTREHVSELSGKPLLNNGHPQWHWQFLHLLGKGAYPAFKLREDNIILALPDEHEKQEEFEEFILRKDEMKRLYYKEIFNKEF